MKLEETTFSTVPAPAPATQADEAAARRTLRDQIARLDGELSALVLSAWPHPLPGVEAARTRQRPAAVLSLAELERARDRLAAVTSSARQALDALGARQELARRAREELLADPHAHRFARVTNEDVGECGCRDWHVRPRFGLLGMLAGWWRVVVSSGCPRPARLAGASTRGRLRGVRNRAGRVHIDMESVWNYPRPPRLEPCTRRVRVVLGGHTIADSTRAFRVLETSHPPGIYIPLEDFVAGALQPSRNRRTLCEWKGLAGYFDIRGGDGRLERAAGWAYPAPVPDYTALKDHVSVYPARMDACYLDDELVTPQDGEFYGGWITSDIEGPFKGAPGTFGW
jgi:uncharacterized protein (DUF427 family)